MSISEPTTYCDYLVEKPSHYMYGKPYLIRVDVEHECHVCMSHKGRTGIKVKVENNRGIVGSTLRKYMYSMQYPDADILNRSVKLIPKCGNLQCLNPEHMEVSK